MDKEEKDILSDILTELRIQTAIIRGWMKQDKNYHVKTLSKL